jgi:hypothetical protein
LPAANKIRPSVAIKNPHLIFVGQKLLLPMGRQTIERSGNPASINAGKQNPIANIQSIPVQYSVESREYTQVLPAGFIAKVKISADVTLQSTKSISYLKLKNNDLSITANIKQKNEKTMNDLLSNFTVGLNIQKNQISFESKITLNAGKSYEQTWSSKVSLDSITGLPTYTISISFPEIKGKLEDQVYLASKYQVDISISKGSAERRVNPSAAPVNFARTSQEGAWVYAQATALVTSAVVIVVGTIVEDVFTAGFGITDDVVCFALAAGLFSRAILLVRAHQLSVTLASASSIGSAVAL